MARERKHKPKPRKRRRFGAIRKLLSTVLTVAAISGACLVFFRINQVEVAGNERYLAQDVVQASGIGPGGSLILLGQESAIDRILDQLPYVKSAEIQRALPDRVIIRIQEYEAAAVISGSPGGLWILASQGKILEQSDNPQGLLQIFGLSAHQPVPGEYVAAESGLENRLNLVLELIQLLEERDILRQCETLQCNNTFLMLRYLSFDLKLPYHGDFGEMLNLLEKALESGEITVGTEGVCDFTVTDGRMYFQRRK